MNVIDRFILARLDKEGLKPSREADKETLINRVTLTLTGLPPTLDEVDAFLADKSPNAYEKVVDRLLASPAYGENMTAYWMNIARYSESDGFLDDHHDRLFWPYRDWVISAFNKNMPFDQFSTWQLAGDLLPNATKEQKARDGISAGGQAHDGKRRDRRRVSRGVCAGSCQCDRTGLPRADHGLRPLPRSQIRSDCAEGILFACGFFNSADEPGFFAPGFSSDSGRSDDSLDRHGNGCEDRGCECSDQER